MKSYPSRPRLSLDGEFRFTFDPENRGLTEEWFRQSDIPAGRIPVPLPWQAALRTHQPVGWYWKRFAIPPTFKGNRIFLSFGAVDAVCDAWVNGRPVGRHVGGYVPFSFDITEAAVQPGSNLLAVRVVDVDSSRPCHPEVPPDVCRGGQGAYCEVSGIWQSVHLEGRPPLFIGEAVTRTEIDPPVFHAELRLVLPELKGRPVEVEGRLLTLEGETIARERIQWEPAMEDEVRLSLRPDPAAVVLWCPDSPHLYVFEAEVFLGGTREDLLRLRTGFRTISASSSCLLMNGEPLYVRGILDPGLYTGGGGWSPGKATAIREEITRYRDLGFNLVRTRGKPFLPAALDACDELGLLVWEETPLADGSPWEVTGADGVRGTMAASEIEALVRRDRHHPSLVIWGLTSENLQSTTVHGGRWMHQMCLRVRELDPGVLVVENSDPFHFGAGTARSDILDFHAYRDMPGRDPATSKAASRIPNLSALNSEFGAWGFPSPEGLDRMPCHARLMARLREQFDSLGLGDTFASVEDFALDTQAQQFQSIKEQIEDFRLNPKVTGHVLNGGYDAGGNCTGVADFLRRPRSFSDRIKALHSGLLAVVEWPTRNFRCGTEVRLSAVLSNRTSRPIRNWRLRYRAGRTGIMLARGEAAGLELPPGAYAGMDGITIPLPELDAVTTFKLVLGWEGDDGAAVETDSIFWAYPPLEAVPALPVSVNLSGSWPGLWSSIPNLEAASFDTCDLLLATSWDKAVDDALAAGGSVILICDRLERGKVGATTEVERPLKTSFVRQHHPIFAEFPHCRRVDARFAALLPSSLMTGVKHPLAGFFREWDYVGSAVAEFQAGKGRLLATTFRFDRLEDDPMTAHLLHSMIQYAAGESFRPAEPLFL